MTNPNRFSFLIVLTIILLASLWIMFSRLVAPPLIQRAYREESVPIVNIIISKRATYSIEDYLTKWDKITKRGLLILLSTGLVVLVITRPEFQRLVDARPGILKRPPPAFDASIPLERTRIWLANAVIAVIIGGSLFEYLAGAENWPFSRYPMYSGVQRERSFSVLRLFGVTDEERPHEIPLTDFRYIQPLDEIRLWIASDRMLRHPNSQQLLSEALRDCLARYEALRLAGRHEGPPLQGIRLYRLSWELDPWARNIEQPDRRDLILGIGRSEGKVR